MDGVFCTNNKYNQFSVGKGVIYIKYPIELLGLTKAKENQFIAKGLTSVEDIAYFFPRKYMDFR